MTSLRELERAATPAPWPGNGEGVGDFPAYTLYAKSDAELVLAMRNALPYLLDVVEAAQAFAGDDRDWDRDALGDPGPALTKSLAALDAHLRGEK